MNTETQNNKAVILLSGGLDSVVSLAMAKEKNIDIKLALTFDYGQKAFVDENIASSKIADFYKIEHKVIKLPFLKEITNNALTDKNNNNFDSFDDVWIPNRNGLFLNIAGCYCDKFNFGYIIFGANKEEAASFPDNTKEFTKIADSFFEFATLTKPKIFAPCLNFDKIEIINYAIDNNVPLNLIKSCYNASFDSNKKHCGRCMSCKLLYSAITKSKKPELIKEIFE